MSDCCSNKNVDQPQPERRRLLKIPPLPRLRLQENATKNDSDHTGLLQHRELLLNGRPEPDVRTGCRASRNDDVQTRLRIMQMDCPTEETLLRKNWQNYLPSAILNSI